MTNKQFLYDYLSSYTSAYNIHNTGETGPKNTHQSQLICILKPFLTFIHQTLQIYVQISLLHDLSYVLNQLIKRRKLWDVKSINPESSVISFEMSQKLCQDLRFLGVDDSEQTLEMRLEDLIVYWQWALYMIVR